MFLKLLLTASVILGALLVLRARNRRAVAPLPLPRPPAYPKSRLPGFAAFGLVLIMLVGTGYYLFQQWWDAYQVVTVRVINANTGSVVRYEVYKGDVDRQSSSFHTVDGRLVMLAAVERMELGGD